VKAAMLSSTMATALFDNERRSAVSEGSVDRKPAKLVASGRCEIHGSRDRRA